MTRLNKDYDREEFWDEVTHARALAKAVENEDWDVWVSNRTMYLTSCLETFMQEGGFVGFTNDEYKNDPELRKEIHVIEKQAMEVFGKNVFVRVQHIDKRLALAIVTY